MPVETERPAPPPLPGADQVPVELRVLKRWVGWRCLWDEGKGKWKKPPCSPKTGEAIGAVDKYLDHFLTFDEALEGVQKYKLDGIGFVFREIDGFLGVDFDDCRTDGVIQQEVLDWLRWMPSYQEVSPSGTGVHVIGKGRIPRAVTPTPLGSGAALLEVYNSGRYFTFTGNRIGDRSTIEDIQTGVDKIRSHISPRSKNVEEETAERPMSRITARKIHTDNLANLKHAAQGTGNATLNSAAFFAARAHAAGVLDGTAEAIQEELFKIVTQDWKQPHPEHGARQTIQSGWHTGLDQPLELCENDFPQVDELLDDFNQRFYIVEDFGGRTRVCWEEPNPTFTKGKALLLGHQSRSDFKFRFEHQLIETGKKTVKDQDGESVEVPKLEDKATVWLRHRYRRQFQQVRFVPNEDLGPKIRNLWHGFAFEPKKGDCSLYLAHLKENICRNESLKYDYLIPWMAYAVRHPNEQGHAAVVVQGLKGVGKNVFAEGFAALWGQHSLVVSDSSRITNNFNAHLRALCVLVADEAFFAGDRRHEGKLKSLVTSGVLDIEAKGVDVVQVPNLLHIIILGNDRWLIPASPEERRYLVMNCSDKYRNDQKYFGAIQRQLDQGGYAALLYYLMYEVDMTNFNVRNVPHTAELRAQMTETLRDVERVWYDCLYTGIIPGRLQKDGTALLRTIDLVNWAGGNGRWNGVKPQHVGGLLGDGTIDQPGMKFVHERALAQGERLRYWIIPKLSTARDIWDKLRVKNEWPDDGGEWDTLDQEMYR